MKRSPKRRSRRPVARFVRRFWLLGVMLAAAVAYGTYRLIELPAFHYSSLAVNGASRVTRDEVLARAAIDPSANVWLLDRNAIERRVEAIPYVATARLSIHPPAALEIAIAERTVDGCVRAGSGPTLTIDATDRVLEADCTFDARVTYVVRGNAAAAPGRTLHNGTLVQLQRDRQTLDPNGDRYRAYAFDAFGQLVATLRSGVVVAFGDDADLRGKERLVGPILAQVAVGGRPVREVDLRAERTPVVVFQHRSPAHPHPLHRAINTI